MLPRPSYPRRVRVKIRTLGHDVLGQSDVNLNSNGNILDIIRRIGTVYNINQYVKLYIKTDSKFNSHISPTWHCPVIRREVMRVKPMTSEHNEHVILIS